MAQPLKDIIENTKEIFMSDSALSTLLDLERVISELDTYVFDNWKFGELVSGPNFEKYFVSATFMWPYKKMPDPRGGERLLDYGCEITYKRDYLEYPMVMKDQDDFEPGTKMPKMKRSKVWLVELTIPKQLMSDIKQGSLEIEGENIDIDEIEQAYEEGVDEDETEGDQDNAAETQPGEMGGEIPPAGQQQQPPLPQM